MSLLIIFRCIKAIMLLEGFLEHVQKRFLSTCLYVLSSMYQQKERQRKKTYPMLYQSWRRMPVYFKYIVSASYYSRLLNRKYLKKYSPLPHLHKNNLPSSICIKKYLKNTLPSSTCIKKTTEREATMHFPKKKCVRMKHHHNRSQSCLSL